VNQAAAIIRETAHPDVNMIFGAVIDPDMADEVRVTVIATGFERSGVPRRALERLTTRTERPASHTGMLSAPAAFSRPTESISVSSDFRPSSESKSITPPATFGNDDLDVPTFLRNRR
jgi:cell division protein FtsZ